MPAERAWVLVTGATLSARRANVLWTEASEMRRRRRRLDAGRAGQADLALFGSAGSSPRPRGMRAIVAVSPGTDHETSRPAIATPSGLSVCLTRIDPASPRARPAFAFRPRAPRRPRRRRARCSVRAAHRGPVDLAGLDALAGTSTLPGLDTLPQHAAAAPPAASSAHDSAGAVDGRLQRHPGLVGLDALEDHRLVAHRAADEPLLAGPRRRQPLRIDPLGAAACSSRHAKLWWL